MSMSASLTDLFVIDPPPCPTLPRTRSVLRASFSQSPSNRPLKIYDPLSDSIVLDPFSIQVHTASIRRLLELPDQELLDLTSTSPDAEEERFVADIKSLYSYVLARAGIYGEKWRRNVFGMGRGKPLVYPRVATN